MTHMNMNQAEHWPTKIKEEMAQKFIESDPQVQSAFSDRRYGWKKFMCFLQKYVPFF